jgi:Na+/H+ antiporter NhaD/arsenite permease-like protein
VTGSGIAIYLVAGLIGLVSAAAALLIPLWRRGGTAEIRRQARPIVRLFGGLVIFVVAIVLANGIGLGPAVNLGLAGASVAVALMWLRRSGERKGHSLRLRRVAWLTLALSIGLVVIALANAATR